jgi:hypothetical protein
MSGTLPLPVPVTAGPNVYACVVVGDSMNGDGIPADPRAGDRGPRGGRGIMVTVSLVLDSDTASQISDSIGFYCR